MKSSTDISKLVYDLKPDEFERLVAELLQHSGFSDLQQAARGLNQGVDFLAVEGNEPVGIEVKHRERLSTAEIKGIIERYSSNKALPRKFVLVTSAKVTPSHFSILETIPHGLQAKIIGFDELQALLSAHSDVAKRFLGRARQRTASQKRELLFSLLGAVASLLALVATLTSGFLKQRQPLDARIQTVEQTLKSMRDLEGYLGKIKEDMIATESASREINKRYVEAKELEKLTDVQIQALKQTLQAERWWKTLLNYGLGFVLGIASSFLASILHARWKQKVALKSG